MDETEPHVAPVARADEASPASPPVAPPSSPHGLARLRADAVRLARFAAKYGALLALLCHLLPHHYRVVCNAVASFCTGGR